MIPISLPAGTQRIIDKLDELLHATYGAPEHLLENKEDPLDEAVYIILSFQTNLNRLKAVWRELRTAFPSWETLAEASDEDLADVIRPGGLHVQKARTIGKLLRAVRSETGSYSLGKLRKMKTSEADRFLTRLPGLSWKGARCVLLYSLGRRVLPVDVNTFRIFARVGILPPDSVYRRRALHDGLQEATPPAIRKRFHINLVVHGQTTCRPRPLCGHCPAQLICKKVGVPRRQQLPRSSRRTSTPNVSFAPSVTR